MKRPGACSRGVIKNPAGRMDFIRVILTDEFYPGKLKASSLRFKRRISMLPELSNRFTAFAGSRLIASGDLVEVATKSKETIDREADVAVLVFDDRTGRPFDVDFRGTHEDVLHRLRGVGE